ncbi:hypothetical protein [Streptomyces luteogriseus]|uniref:hypothetical protein n=1 Tax=Streptomyces luteogriseus TaxID=68233 RepID=UPI002E2ED5AA|nr:hypothetical protein [Streptomyces luteogriseus]
MQHTPGMIERPGQRDAHPQQGRIEPGQSRPRGIVKPGNSHPGALVKPGRPRP